MSGVGGKKPWTADCARCREPFEVLLSDSPPGARWWYQSAVPLYCKKCRLHYDEAHESVRSCELKRALNAGEISASRLGRPLSELELLDLQGGPTLALPASLAGAGVAVSPMDWWHIHLANIGRQLVCEQRWHLAATGAGLFEVHPDGTWSKWRGRVQDLPPEDLPELLEHGAVRFISSVVRKPGGISKEHSDQLFDAARKRVLLSDAKARFEALLVLLWLERGDILQDLLDTAVNPQEHPRVRGLAVEGLPEAIDRDVGTPWAERALRLIERLLADPEPEVRWWACFAASRVDRERWIRRAGQQPKAIIPAYNRRLVKALGPLLGDPTPAGFGWSVGKAASDAISHLKEGSKLPDRPMWSPYDPWDCIGITSWC